MTCLLKVTELGKCLLRFAIALVVLCAVTSVDAKPFDCVEHHCGLLTKGNNPDLVVGTLDGIASKKTMRHVFDWARRHGYWSSLPSNGIGYLKYVRLVSVAVLTSTGNRSVTVLMTRQEFESASLQLGAFVRYSPHDSAHDAISYKDPVHQAYWMLVGCVAQLCAPNDQGCVARYLSGRFNRKDGHELRLASGIPVKKGSVIDPLTLLPVKRGANH